MEIVYKNTYADRLYFQIFGLSRLLAIRLIAAFYVVLLIYNFIPAFMDPRTDSINKAICFLFYFFAWFVGWLIMCFILLIFVSPRKDKGFLTEHKILLAENGLTEVTEVNRSEAYWNGIYNVLSTKRYIFIYTSKLSAHVIPKRSFRSKADYDNFFKYALNLWQNAQNQ